MAARRYRDDGLEDPPVAPTDFTLVVVAFRFDTITPGAPEDGVFARDNTLP